MRILRSHKILLSVVIFGMFSSVFSAPAKNLWPHWSVYQASSTSRVDHRVFQEFLNRYVHTSPSGINLVSYNLVTSEDKVLLKSYLKQLSQIPISQYNRNEQLAYWINLYNALTIDLVLQHYPVKSILDIKLGGWFSIGPWSEKLITIEGLQLSLNDIEHRIIRPIWNDPRTHYALNCASYSCPNLQKQVYSASAMNEMLKQSAKDYVNSIRAVQIASDRLILSRIYDWYKADFGGTDQAIINHLKEYANPELKKKLDSFTRVSSYEYDWQLNGS